MESAENRKQPMPNNELGNDDVLSKTETIKLLNDSIDRLEQTLERISQDSATVPSDSIKTLITTTQELADAVTPVIPPVPESPLPENKIEPAPIETPIETKSASPKVTTPPANQIEQLTTVKAQRKKSLILITICVAAIAIAIVAVFQIWLPKQQSALVPASESIAPAPEPTITETVPNLNSQIDRALEAPLLEPTQLDNSQSDIEPIVVDLPSAAEPTVESETIAEIIPPDLESPGRAKNLKIVAIKPKISFTPEQTLIAALQSKVANLTQDYPSEAIALVRVDVPQSSLAVEVTDSWYELGEPEQTKLANEMLKRSRQLGYTKLELKDGAGTLVARNPVIGEEIVILQNSKDEPVGMNNL